MDINELRQRVEGLADEIRGLAEIDTLTDEQRSDWDEKTAAYDEARAALDDRVERAARAERAAQVPQLQIIQRVEHREVLNDRDATPGQLADSVTRSLEDRGISAAEMQSARVLLKRHQSDREWVRNVALRSSDEYASAFMKMITGRAHDLTAEERASMAVGTNTAGGVSVPTHLDPTIILTNSGTSNAIRGISRVVTLTTGNVWNGVTSAGITANWDAELAETSDDTPNDFARVSIPLYKAAAFAQASEEALQDIAGLESDLLRLFADAKDRLEGAAHATGSGSAQPTGIFTALDANTNVELTSATAATIALADVQSVYRSVPVRFRGSSTWVMNPLHLGTIQALGSAVGAAYSTDITESYTARLLGRPVVESDDAPTTATTTVRDNEIVLGDFSNFVIVDKPGSMSVTFIPVMFNTSNNLPDGRVGWRVAWRTGSDSVNDLAFRLLQDKTSA